jgi:hypothetical protein
MLQVRPYNEISLAYNQVCQATELFPRSETSNVIPTKQWLPVLRQPPKGQNDERNHA